MKIKRLSAIGLCILLMLGAVGCMDTKASVQKEMLNYLEDKYGETFEVEYFDKGDVLFPEIYGGDKMMVYPTSNPDIPFYVYKNVETDGFYDIYVPSYFSHQFTQQHMQNIISMDSRDKAVKIALSSANRPVEADVLKRSVEDVVRDKNYIFNINLFMAVRKEGNLDAEAESDFLYNIYKYMDGIKNEKAEVHIGVAYVSSELFDEAVKLLRISHTINFGWYILGDEDLLNVVYFGSRADINDSSYFNEFFE